MREVGLILFWDPENSHYSMDSFEYDLWNLFTGYDIEPLFWGINNKESIEQGTGFIVVKTGNGNCGVVMSGYLLEEHRFDVSGRRHCRSHYRTDSEVILAVMEMFHPDRSQMISLEQLKEAFPHLSFDGSVKDLLLNQADSKKLGNLHESFLAANKDIFEPKAARRPVLPCP